MCETYEWLILKMTVKVLYSTGKQLYVVHNSQICIYLSVYVIYEKSIGSINILQTKNNYGI